MLRRDFLKNLGAGAMMTALSGPALAQSQADTRPNILIILADDMGYSDIACYGGEINTPNLDRLAANGLRFSQFYNAARCCPTRAALLTGLYPHQAGMGSMVSHAPSDKKAKPSPYQGYLNQNCRTIAEVLRPAGYSTYMSGKWHVGEAEAHWPKKRGFDRYFGLISGASSYWQLRQETRHKRVMVKEDQSWTPQGEDFYMTDAFTNYAIECLKAHEKKNNPFFMYLAYTAPHWPLHAWPEDIAKYEGKYMKGWDALRKERYERLVKLGLIQQHWPLSERGDGIPAWEEVEDKKHLDRRMAVYAAMIDRMDQGIGRVLDTLESTGQLDNTLILFMSDNGGCNESVAGRKMHDPDSEIGLRGSFVAYLPPWANASNTPFRLYKKYIHEGGIATPCIAHWPKGIQARGDITHQIGHVTDFMATCIDLAGADYPKDAIPVEGKSLRPIFDGKQRPGHDCLCWEHYGNKGVRQGKWKLVTTKEGEWELYDMEKDRTEHHDLSEQFPEKCKELLDRYRAWAKKTGAHL